MAEHRNHSPLILRSYLRINNAPQCRPEYFSVGVSAPTRCIGVWLPSKYWSASGSPTINDQWSKNLAIDLHRANNISYLVWWFSHFNPTYTVSPYVWLMIPEDINFNWLFHQPTHHKSPCCSGAEGSCPEYLSQEDTILQWFEDWLEDPVSFHTSDYRNIRL